MGDTFDTFIVSVSIYTEYGILYSETFVEKNENLSAQEMKSDNSLQIFPKDENTSRKPYMGKKKNINILMILWYIGLLVLLYIILYRGLLFVEEQRMQRRYLHRMKSMSGKKAWLVLSA